MPQPTRTASTVTAPQPAGAGLFFQPFSGKHRCHISSNQIDAQRLLRLRQQLFF
jgi:hypothetical protein